MSETASELLAAFDSMSPREQHELVAAMLRRSGECPDAPMPDEGLVALADHLFQTLDLEESHGDDA